MYDNVLSTALKFVSDTKTTEYSTDSILQSILTLSSDTLEENFIHKGKTISDFPNLKEIMIALDIERSLGKDIIE